VLAVVSACGYVLFVAAGTVPSFVTIMIGAAIVGTFIAHRRE
jgi:hypothetical protein